MNDDLEQETGHQIIARGIALAEGQTNDDNYLAMSVPQPEVKPRDAIVPTKIWNSNDVCIQHFFTMEQLDVTDGNWHALNIAHSTAVATDGNMFETIVGDITAISLYDLMGGPIGFQIGNMWKGRETRSNNELYKYTWGRLKNVSVELGNFSVTIERDASGGIQFKDEPVFEIAFAPNLGVKIEPEDGNLMPNSSYSSTLSEGITMSINLASSLFLLDELTMKYKPEGKNYYVYYYPTIAGLLANDYPPNVKHDFTMPPRYWLHSPTFTCFIRMVNVPRGVSNIKIYLAYTSNVKAHWDCYCFQSEQYLQYVPPGTKVPMSLTNVPYSAVRKIHPRNPLAIYSTVENQKIDYSVDQMQLLSKYKRTRQ